jgi:hypothetical protein
MKVKDIIAKLKTYPQDMDFFVSCDEEMNTLYSECDMIPYDDDSEGIVIFGLSGSEVEQE